MSRRNAPESLPDHLRSAPTSRDEVRVPWVRDGWYWGPACPQDASHGALIDLKGSDKWYCRHQRHNGRGVYQEANLLDLEWERLTSAEQQKEPDPLPLPTPESTALEQSQP